MDNRLSERMQTDYHKSIKTLNCDGVYKRQSPDLPLQCFHHFNYSKWAVHIDLSNPVIEPFTYSNTRQNRLNSMRRSSDDPYRRRCPATCVCWHYWNIMWKSECAEMMKPSTAGSNTFPTFSYTHVIKETSTHVNQDSHIQNGSLTWFSNPVMTLNTT